MIKLKINLKYCLAFYAVIMLHVSMHELVHHFVAAIICGEWGTKTFNSFHAACKEPVSLIATYAGPFYSFAMMYVGAHWLRKGKSDYKKQLGFATIFAQLAAQRITGPLLGFNDELYATRLLFGYNSFTPILVALVITAICLPPLIQSYKAIGNKRKVLWFLFYFLLFPYLLFGPFFGVLEYLMVQKGVLDQTIIGIGLLFIINEIFTIALFWRTKQFLVSSDD